MEKKTLSLILPSAKKKVREKGDAQRVSAPNSPEFEKKAGCTSVWKDNPI